MESDELRFKHVGLSSDSAVIFCEMDNGKTYAMPILALEQAEDWDPKAKAKAAGIIHDAYAAFVEFDTRVKIDFPAQGADAEKRIGWVHPSSSMARSRQSEKARD